MALYVENLYRQETGKGGPLTTLKALAANMEDGCNNNNNEGEELRVKDNVVASLTDAGATHDFCEFFADALQCEHDMTLNIYRLQQALKFDHKRQNNPDKLLKAIQDLTKSFNQWKATIEQLVIKGKDIPPLQVNMEKLQDSKILKALCSLQTKDINLREGDTLTITDSSQPNKLKVMDSQGVEAYVPALCCVLPTPDRNALNAAERLRIQLLASWTESVKRTQTLLLESLNGCVRAMAADWKADFQAVETMSRDRVTRRFKRILDTANKQQPTVDLSKLHNTLFSLEREMGSLDVNGTDISKMVDTVSNLDKSVLCHQMFHKQWTAYRCNLEREQRPIRIIDGLEELRMARPGKSYKYFEVKMTLENTETVEEILYVNNQQNMSDSRGDQWTRESGERRESVKADQITKATQEENKRFVIKAVVDPRTNEDISIQDAIKYRIVIKEAGIYTNPDTGSYLTIQEAMDRNLIKVDFVSTRKTAEKVTAIGLIRIKTRVDSRPYSIASVTDSFTGEEISLEEATNRGVIDEEHGFYIIGATGQRITLDSAIDKKWVTPNYGPEGPPECEVKTYAVNAVVDQRLRKKVPFQDAVRRGLIDKTTGNYINNVTGEHVYVADAIQKGFLKAKVVEDGSMGLDIDASNTVVVERMDLIRKNVLKPLKVINAMKKAMGQDKGTAAGEESGKVGASAKSEESSA